MGGGVEIASLFREKNQNKFPFNIISKVGFYMDYRFNIS